MTGTVGAIVAHGAHDLRVERIDEQPLEANAVAVQTVVGGICGSDLHYFHRGRVGDFTIREPLVLGHEVCGVVARVGAGVTDLAPGARVAIDPSLPCGACEQCRRGARNLCSDVRFLGSAARMPHAQGGFRERLVVDRAQCVALPDQLAFRDAVFAEPLAVALHAVGRAGPLLGRDVLITGAGPIGMLILIASLKAGAATVTITDIAEAPLAIARAVGATAAINVAGAARLPTVDVALEASAAGPRSTPACSRSGPAAAWCSSACFRPARRPSPPIARSPASSSWPARSASPTRSSARRSGCSPPGSTSPRCSRRGSRSRTRPRRSGPPPRVSRRSRCRSCSPRRRGDALPGPRSDARGSRAGPAGRVERPVGLAELARRLGLPKSSIANICSALVDAGLVRRDDGRYRLGHVVLELGSAYLGSTSLPGEFADTAAGLPVASQETLLLAQLDGTDVLYLARHDGTQPIRLASDIGRRLPANCTALGKAMLAQLDPADVAERYRRLPVFPVLSESSKPTVEALLDDLDTTRARGYAIDDEENTPGIRCFGVPILSDPLRAVSVTLLKARATDELEQRLVADLQRLASRLGRRSLRGRAAAPRSPSARAVAPRP